MKSRKLLGLSVLAVMFSCSSSKQITEHKTESFISSNELTMPNKLKLDSLFKALEDNDKFMGSIVLSKKGKVIYSNSIGYSNIETKEKNTNKTKYRIGSVSKMFTSVLIFKAIEGNKILLDQTIEKYFPELQNSNKITIGNLLNHRSGIGNFTNNEAYLNWHSQKKSKKEMLDIILNEESVFEPNTKSRYSNSNYVLLTFILEEEYKKEYKDLISEQITIPLGLKETYVGNAIGEKSNEAFSYSYTTGWGTETETDMSIPLGAGAIVSSPSELALFIEGLFNGKLVTDKSLNKMKSIEGDYGMGIFKFPFDDKYSYGHPGSIDGFNTYLSYFQEDELAISLCANGTNYDDNEILIAALSCYFNKPYDLPSFKQVKVDEATLKKYVGVYSSAEMPLEIEVTTKNGKLIAQGTGQPAMAIDAKGNHIFTFDQAGAEFEFNIIEKTMILKQGGGEYKFIKE